MTCRGQHLDDVIGRSVKMTHLVPVDDVDSSRFAGGEQEVGMRRPAQPLGRIRTPDDARSPSCLSSVA